MVGSETFPFTTALLTTETKDPDGNLVWKMHICTKVCPSQKIETKFKLALAHASSLLQVLGQRNEYTYECNHNNGFSIAYTKVIFKDKKLFDELKNEIFPQNGS